MTVAEKEVTSSLSRDELNWFNNARYGMFIHWGPYAVAGRGEWAMNRERIPLDEYKRLYVDTFKAERFDADAWVKLAKEAGMKYMVLTSRHLDGFSLWDTATSDYNAVTMGPKRDLVREYVDAARRGGMKVGLYYCVADLSHSDYPDPYGRDWPTGWHDEAARNRYISYYHTQLRELMSNYGRIDLLWWDGCVPTPTNGAEINAVVRKLQPHILINGRNEEEGDFDNCEQAIHPPNDHSKSWEACMTLNDNWGFHSGDDNWKTPVQVAKLLCETARNGGNLLLNVGPRSDGTIPEASVERLQKVGAWLNTNGEFLPNSTRSPFSWVNWGDVTLRDQTLYLHLFRPVGPTLCYAELNNRVTSIRLVDGGRALPFEQTGDRLFIHDLPTARDPIATVIAVELEGRPAPITQQTSFWIPG